MEAHVPPADRPATASECLPTAALKLACMKLGTSVTRYVSALPKALFEHSESWVSFPLLSGITRIGEMPWCSAANSVDVESAYPARVQSEGWPGTPAMSSMTGSWGSGLLNQMGGR